MKMLLDFIMSLYYLFLYSFFTYLDCVKIRGSPKATQWHLVLFMHPYNGT